MMWQACGGKEQGGEEKVFPSLAESRKQVLIERSQRHCMLKCQRNPQCARGDCRQSVSGWNPIRCGNGSNRHFLPAGERTLIFHSDFSVALICLNHICTKSTLFSLQITSCIHSSCYIFRHRFVSRYVLAMSSLENSLFVSFPY